MSTTLEQKLAAAPETKIIVLDEGTETPPSRGQVTYYPVQTEQSILVILDGLIAQAEGHSKDATVFASANERTGLTSGEQKQSWYQRWCCAAFILAHHLVFSDTNPIISGLL